MSVEQYPTNILDCYFEQISEMRNLIYNFKDVIENFDTTVTLMNELKCKINSKRFPINALNCCVKQLSESIKLVHLLLDESKKEIEKVIEK